MDLQCPVRQSFFWYDNDKDLKRHVFATHTLPRKLYVVDISNLFFRTFLESEVKNPVLRKDLYEKMIKLNPAEPTQEEHEQKSHHKTQIYAGKYYMYQKKHYNNTP